MKLLTHTARRGILVLPGIARLAAGESVKVSEGVANALARVKPPLPIEISEISTGEPKKARRSPRPGKGRGAAHRNRPKQEE